MSIDRSDPCEEITCAEAFDFVRALVRAKDFGHFQAHVHETPEAHIQLVGWLILPEVLTEALRLTGLFDEPTGVATRAQNLEGVRAAKATLPQATLNGADEVAAAFGHGKAS